MMTIEREVQELVARCVAIMVCYLNSERTPEVTAGMVADIRAIAGRLGELGHGDGDAEGLILRPVEDELLARYGHEAGVRLNAAFRDIFEGNELPGEHRGR